MKRIVPILLCLVCALTGCNSDKSRTTNPNYEAIREFAKNAKKSENATFKQTIKEETVVHKREQAKYSAMIAHPEKFAEVVDISTGAPIDNQPSAPAAEFQPANGLPDIANPNTPQTYTIAPNGEKRFIEFKEPNNTCPDGKCPKRK